MEELEEALKKKDEDMKQMEERYKKYLEKAKSVSASFINEGSKDEGFSSGQTVSRGNPGKTRICTSQVIRTLDPKQNQGSGPEVQALKNQLQEKERMLHSLEVIGLLVKN